MTEATSASLPGFERRAAALGVRSVGYEVAGAGPPIVLVHGLGGAASNWVALAPALAARHRVLAVDLPGHGGSDPLPAAHGLASYADAVAVCAGEERLGPACFVGHSFGGAVVLEVALRRPELVSSVVLAAAAGISSSTLRARAGLRTLGVLRPSRLAARYRAQVARRTFLRRLVFAGLAADPDVLSPEAVHGFLQGSSVLSEGRTAADVLLAHDPRPDLDRVTCPVLVLWGARDRFLPLADGHEYSRRLGAPLRVLPDTGHLLISERPDDCAGLIERFLDRAAAGTESDGVRQVDELPVEVEPPGDRPR